MEYLLINYHFVYWESLPFFPFFQLRINAIVIFSGELDSILVLITRERGSESSPLKIYCILIFVNRY